MDECGDYSIRGDVAKNRERDPMMNYPLTLPQGLTEEQIRSLLPLMASHKCKRWDCLNCVKEFMEQDCPHDQQLAINEAAGPSVAASNNLDVPLICTKTNRLIVEKIDAVEVLICTDGNSDEKAEQQPEPKVFFDLNVPIVEPYDELELGNRSNHVPATEELVVAYNHPECSSIAEVAVSVDKQQTRNFEASEPEASAQLPNNGIGNSDNVSTIPEIIVSGGNKRLSIKKARKYHSVSFLNQQSNKEGSQNPLISNPQSNKVEFKNKKKMQQCRTVEEGLAGTNISEATDHEDGSEQNRQNRTLDLVLSNGSLSPRRESSGKRKHQVHHDQNFNSSEKGNRNESRSVDLQLRKRRIFCSVTKTALAGPDQSQRAVPVSHKIKKNGHSSSKSLINPAASFGNSRSTRIKKAASKAAYQPIMLEKKRKNIDRGEPSGTAIDKVSPKKGSHVVVGKELVLQEIPISPIAKDVPIPCLEDDNLNLKQLKSEIIKKLKRHKFDSPSAEDNNQNVIIPTGENGTSLLIHSEKSSRNVGKRRKRPKKVPTSCASSSGTKKKQDDEQTASFGKELVVKDVTTLRPVIPSEGALHLLSMVAVDTLESGALTDAGHDHTFLPIMEEFHVPPITSVLEMGYEGCIEVTNPADHILVDGEGDRFKLGPEDLPLRPHRLLSAKSLPCIAIPTIATAAGVTVQVPAE